jgi:hypothetical protein
MLFLLLVAAYWSGMAVFLRVAYLIGHQCTQPIEYGDQCGHYAAGAWPWTALEVLAVFAFLTALLVFMRAVRRWRLLVYGIQLVLTTLVATLVWLSYGEFTLADETTATPWPWFGIATGGELAALLAIVISIRGRDSPHIVRPS